MRDEILTPDEVDRLEQFGVKYPSYRCDSEEIAMIVRTIRSLRADIEEAQETIGLLFEERGQLRAAREYVLVKLCALQAQMVGDKFRPQVQELARALLDKPDGGPEGRMP